jgi:hypothetical protein
MKRIPLVATLLLAVVLIPSRAYADFTAFLGVNPTPVNRPVRGFSIGAGLLIVGFEFEYGHIVEDSLEGSPSLHTGMGNLLIQTPVAILGLQPYFTTGGGVYREELGDLRSETNFGINTGGGVKISLIGPLRARVDYRVFALKGSPIEATVQRLYVGANLKF